MQTTFSLRSMPAPVRTCLLAVGAGTLLAQVQTYDLRINPGNITTPNSLLKDGVLFFPGQASYYTAQSTGTGVFDPFLTYQKQSGSQQAYNGNKNDGLTAETSDGGDKTKRITIADMAKSQVSVAGLQYYFIAADLNENNSAPGSYISIDQLQISVSANPYVAANGLTDAQKIAGLRSNTTPVWDLDKNGLSTSHDREILLDTVTSAGSGRADAFMLIPKALLDAYPSTYYFYLFTQNGASTFPQMNVDSGFEEWSLIDQAKGGFTFTPPPPAPEASTIGAVVLAITGAVSTAVRRRKRNKA